MLQPKPEEKKTIDSADDLRELLSKMDLPKMEGIKELEVIEVNLEKVFEELRFKLRNIK